MHKEVTAIFVQPRHDKLYDYAATISGTKIIITLDQNEVGSGRYHPKRRQIDWDDAIYELPDEDFSKIHRHTLKRMRFPVGVSEPQPLRISVRRSTPEHIYKANLNGLTVNIFKEGTGEDIWVTSGRWEHGCITSCDAVLGADSNESQVIYTGLERELERELHRAMVIETS
jgi:hypothetical protein